MQSQNLFSSAFVGAGPALGSKKYGPSVRLFQIWNRTFFKCNNGFSKLLFGTPVPISYNAPPIASQTRAISLAGLPVPRCPNPRTPVSVCRSTQVRLGPVRKSDSFEPPFPIPSSSVSDSRNVEVRLRRVFKITPSNPRFLFQEPLFPIPEILKSGLGRFSIQTPKNPRFRFLELPFPIPEEARVRLGRVL